MLAFLIPTAYCFHKYSRSGNRISLGLSVLFYVLAMLSKTSAVFFPFILIILHWRNHGKLTVKRLVPVIPFFLVSGVMGILTLYSQNRLDIIEEQVVNGSMRIALCGWTFLFYLSKSILPINLTIQYESWKEGLENLGLLAYLHGLWGLDTFNCQRAVCFKKLGCRDGRIPVYRRLCSRDAYAVRNVSERPITLGRLSYKESPVGSSA